MYDLITVIIPIYNVEKYLSKCLDSVLAQTYENIEILLINDGSTDNSGLIAEEYSTKDNRIKVYNKGNGGLSDARNTGLSNANGKYITFLDSDDWISHEYIEKLYNLMLKNNADISACEYEIVFSEDHIIESFEIKSCIYSNYEALNLGTITMIISCAKLYKVELFSNIEFPKNRIHEDEFITYRLLYRANKIAYTNEKLHYYRQRNDSIMGKGFSFKNKLDIIAALYEKCAFFENLKDERFQEIISITYRRLFKRYEDVFERFDSFKDCYDSEKFIKDFHELRKKLRKSKQPFSYRLYYEIYYYSPKISKFFKKDYTVKHFIK